MKSMLPTLQRMLYLLLVLLVVVSVITLYFGMMGTRVRVLLVGTLLLSVALFSRALFRAKPRVRAVTISLLVLLLAMLSIKFFSGKKIDSASLRSAYTRELISYLGVRYSWGGETRLGIDCSGLARTALIDAMLTENAPKLWPTAWRFWWHDTSAKGMLEGAGGYCRSIGHAEKLADSKTLHMNSGYTLRPGDMAVTDGGVHVLIYTGSDRWVEASPDDEHVVENSAPHSERAYFNLPVTIVRWGILD